MLRSDRANGTTGSKTRAHSRAPLRRRLRGAMMLLAIAGGCDGRGGAPPADDPLRSPEVSPAGSWQCRNDLEVVCGEGACEAAPEGEFTPMSVHAEGSGAISVCAYSGCWEGTGKLFRDGEFLVWIGHDLPFSTSPDSESAAADVVLAIDGSDGVATLKAGTFAQPLLCESLEG